MTSFVGKQYIDNGDGKDTSGADDDNLLLESYALVDGSVAYTMGSRRQLRLSLDVNNIFDDKVLTYGNVSVVGPQFFPAATRHLNMALKYTFR